MEALQSAVAAAFLLIAGLGIRLWWQRRSPPTAWLAWTFCTLAAAVAADLFTPFLGEDVAAVVAWAVRLAVVAFPYLLFRFVVSFQPVGRTTLRGASLLAGVVLVLTAVVPTPGDGPVPGGYRLYVVAVLVMWTLLSSWVVWRLWRSGRRQPSVIRHRMRTLALAAGVLNAALVLAGLSAIAEAPPTLTAAIQGGALVSAGLFYSGFAPPPILRQLWRRDEERALWKAEGELLSTTSSQEVVSSMLPHISRLLGGGPALFVDREGTQTEYGEVPEDLRARLTSEELAPGAPSASEAHVALQLRGGALGVAVTPATPLFGRDELELLEWLGTLIDLAVSRNELYDREQQARARAEALAGELEALVYGLSHDLRSPIVSVLGYIDCLYEDYGDVLEGDGQHFLARLRTNVAYMDELISDLLALSRIGRVEESPVPLDLTAVVEQTSHELSRVHPHATIEVGPLPVVLIDPARARQLFTNLLTNALVHSGRSDVTVRVTAQAGQPGCIVVSDDGRGIPATHREKIFALFERLESGGKDGHGTGIGLAMCRRIVEQAGGRIWVADSDSGADIRVELPLASPLRAAQTEEAT